MFSGFVQPVLEYCSVVWCSTADTHHKLLDRVVICARFVNWGVCVSVTFLDLWQYHVLYKIRCNPMHALRGALAVP